ncbi:MAG: YhcN/YlaJ family sporulation lipoprotein [Alicyclobacillaceae bacterium]|nr:YhcN/YlaJ family sporulation lipoprotein [Alicyclobacillaceae bacterium]
MFPLGPRLISRADIAGTLRMRPEVLDAVVITEGERAFVAVQTADGEVLSPQMRRTLQKSVRRFAPGVGRVFVASSPEAFADFAAYARYLQSNRQVGGMLLTWRSILQKNWPDEFDQG